MVTTKKAAKKSPVAAEAIAADASGATPAAAPDPAVTLASLRAAGNAEHAAEDCAGRARQIRIATLDLDEKADALAEEVRANNLAGDCSQIEIDLNAAKVKVEELDPGEVATLTDLSQKLDRQIVASQLLNAALTTISDVLDSVVKVRDILSDPSLRA